jgi:hypothetical protein
MRDAPSKCPKAALRPSISSIVQRRQRRRHVRRWVRRCQRPRHGHGRHVYVGRLNSQGRRVYVGRLLRVSDLSYTGDQGGIVCHIVPPEKQEVLVVSLTQGPRAADHAACSRRCRLSEASSEETEEAGATLNRVLLARAARQLPLNCKADPRHHYPRKPPPRPLAGVFAKWATSRHMQRRPDDTAN